MSRQLALQLLLNAAITAGGGMNINTAPRLEASEHDSQAMKRWAAEDFAVAIGLLRECPYHGRPYRIDPSQTPSAAAAHLPDARVALLAFNGDRSELLATAQRVARGFSNTCGDCDSAAEQESYD
jgi:hypothetical protein